MNAATLWDRCGKRYIRQNNASSDDIRLQDYVDAEVSQPPQQNTAIWNKINLVQDELAQTARSGIPNSASVVNDISLYSRFWKETSLPKKVGAVSGNDDTTSQNDNDSKSSFTVAQFNTLARGLSSGPADLFPTPFAKKDSYENNYGGFIRVKNPEVVLDFDRFRKWRLLHVLLGGGVKNDSTSKVADHSLRPAFDIVALEEVDEYNSFFRQVLVNDDDATKTQPSAMGDERCRHCYQGVFQPKPKSPCIPLGWYSDGVALLWNSDKFQTIEESIEKDSFHGTVDFSGNMTDSNGASPHNQVYVIVPLQIRDTDKCVVVAATHLKAKKGAVNERIREAQALELRYRAEKVAETLKERGWKDVSVVIVGDFNSEPSDASVKSILSLDVCDAAAKSWDFQSAYPSDESDSLPGSNLYTTWKTRKDGTTRRIIDYIFYASEKAEGIQTGKGIDCTHYLSIPEDTDVEEGGFPGFRYPSDHLLIAAKFQY